MTTRRASTDHPFDHIALSLSGGGVRAVGYHLGTLDYLEHAKLLPEVHTLSSVSGGSLIAIGYALSLKKGEEFQEFYDNICEFLPELNTFEELLKVLNRPSPPVASGARTLITAMAQVYREKYFEKYYDDPTFGIFWESEPDIPLKELIFSATEFKTGIAFRFQKSQFNSLIGNGKIWLDEKYAKDIRMSDIMAASSCIPGAMEPIMFPQDFRWPGDPEGKKCRGGKGHRPTCEQVEAFMRTNFETDSVPLMDGGIYDNQGITSIIMSSARNYGGSHSDADDDQYDEQLGLEPLRPHAWAKWAVRNMGRGSAEQRPEDLGEVDLFIVSDTPVRKDPMYEAQSVLQASENRLVAWFRTLRLKHLNVWGWALTIVLLASAAGSVAKLYESLHAKGPTLWDGPLWSHLSILFSSLTILSSLVVWGLVLYGLIRIRMLAERQVEKMSDEMPPIHRSLWSYARTLRVGQLLDMATSRAGSMSALTSRIFMNRIRQLGYSLLFSHEKFGKKVMDNNISDIKTMQTGRSDDLPSFVQRPSEKMLDVVERASTMGTKLWIHKPDHERDDLEVLIASGHASTCFNIIEYLWEFHRDEEGDVNANVQPLFERTHADWRLLNQDPYHFVDLRKHVGRKHGSLFWDSSLYARKRWSVGRGRKKNSPMES